MLYHIVGRCGIPIEMETVVRTAAGGGVIGLKETESVGRVTRLRELCDVPIFSGDDGLTFPMIAMGAIGVVSVASNLVPDRIAELVRHARDGEMAAARACHDDLAPLFRALFREPNPCPVKSAMQIVGMLPSDDVRLPLVATSDSVRAELNSLLG